MLPLRSRTTVSLMLPSSNQTALEPCVKDEQQCVVLKDQSALYLSMTHEYRSFQLL